MKEILSNGASGPKGMSVHILVDTTKLLSIKIVQTYPPTVLLNQMGVLPVLLELLKPPSSLRWPCGPLTSFVPMLLCLTS